MVDLYIRYMKGAMLRRSLASSSAASSYISAAAAVVSSYQAASIRQQPDRDNRPQRHTHPAGQFVSSAQGPRSFVRSHPRANAITVQ